MITTMKTSSSTILVVEDEKSLLNAWAEIFRREGLNVLTAPDGKSALNLALRWRPDLVVVDLVLPHSDGLALVKKLRENKWGQKIPVMYLSSRIGPEAEKKPPSSLEPADSYLEENWSFEQVVREAKNKLSLAKLNSSA